MTDPISARGSIGWTWPCIQCGGCQPEPEPSSDQSAPTWTVEAESTFAGVDVAPGGTINFDIDMTFLPDNALAVVSFIIAAFDISGAPLSAVSVFGQPAIATCYRDGEGHLWSDAAFSNLAGGSNPFVGSASPLQYSATPTSAPDINTFRIQMSNPTGRTVQVFRRQIVSWVQCDDDVGPPVGA